MGLLRRKQRDSNGFWRTGLSAETLQDNTPYPLKINGEAVIVTRIGDQIYAFSATCPHAAAELSGETLHRGRISCPLHGWKFDIRTGRTLWPEDETCRLQHFEVRTSAEITIKLQ
jgi:nitrite reductase/ring-hydroxylating ferredoxin subunit